MAGIYSSLCICMYIIYPQYITCLSITDSLPRFFHGRSNLIKYCLSSLPE